MVTDEEYKAFLNKISHPKNISRNMLRKFNLGHMSTKDARSCIYRMIDNAKKGQNEPPKQAKKGTWLKNAILIPVFWIVTFIIAPIVYSHPQGGVPPILCLAPVTFAYFAQFRFWRDVLNVSSYEKESERGIFVLMNFAAGVCAAILFIFLSRPAEGWSVVLCIIYEIIKLVDTNF